MVGPQASVLTPCVSRLTAIRWKLWAFVIGLSLLAPSPATAQGPGGPIQQVGFGGHGSAISRHLHPYPIAHCPDGACPQVTYEYVPPDSRGGHLAALGDEARRLWYRLEYLNWSIKAPGENPLGANRLDGNNQGPFQAFLPTGEADEQAIQPTGRVFDLQKNNGLRFGIGIPSQIGDVEASVFVLEQADGGIRLLPERRFDLTDPAGAADQTLTTTEQNAIPNVFPATSLTDGGQLNNNSMILYNVDYIANYKTEIFGTEANLVLNPLTPNQPLTVRPIVGFQYINYRENMLIAGSDVRLAEDPDDPTLMVEQTLDHRIDARSRNNMFAPQVGVRAEFVHEWFSIGVTPKFMLGFNRHRDQLTTAQIFAVGDGRFQREDATEFAPGLDLKVDARVHLNEHFSLFVGYQLYVLSNISRPLTNVTYDENNGVNNISLNSLKQHQVWFGNVSVGGELRFH